MGLPGSAIDNEMALHCHVRCFYNQAIVARTGEHSNMRIVFFGDSLTEGVYGVDYVGRIAASLSGHTVINRGHGGDTSYDLLRRLGQDVLALQLDGVFVMIGVNDASAILDSRRRPDLPAISADTFRDNMRDLLSKLTRTGCRVWVALEPAELNPALVETVRTLNDHTGDICRELQIPTLDVFSTLLPEVVPQRRRSLLARYSLALARRIWPSPNYDLWRKAGGYSYSFDGVHLTENGAQRIADQVVRFLRLNGVE